MYEKILALAPYQTFIIAGTADDALMLAKNVRAAGASIHESHVPVLTIEHAQLLAAQNAEAAEKDHFIICSFGTASADVYQVLLKTLEEPGSKKFFCLITPRPLMLPLTVRSRAQFISAGGKETNFSFANLSAKQKQVYLAEYFTGEGIAAERKVLALNIFDELELYAAKTKKLEVIKIIYDAKKMILEGNMVPKQVLEYVVTALA